MKIVLSAKFRIAIGFAILALPITAKEINSMQTHKKTVEGAVKTTQELLGVPGHLGEVGDRFDCYFTFERFDVPTNTGNERRSIMLIKSKMPLDSNVTTVEALVKDLQNKLVDVTVILDQTDKGHPVIHLIDNPLAKRDDYIMDKKIDLQYAGIVGELAAKLEKRFPAIEPPRSGSIPTDAFNDHVTKVNIDVDSKPIRDILTHCVNLDEYGRFIWRSNTYRQDDGTWKTQVRFYGPKNQ